MRVARNIDVHIRALRKKLAAEGDLIQTIRGYWISFYRPLDALKVQLSALTSAASDVSTWFAGRSPVISPSFAYLARIITDH